MSCRNIPSLLSLFTLNINNTISLLSTLDKKNLESQLVVIKNVNNAKYMYKHNSIDCLIHILAMC